MVRREDMDEAQTNDLLLRLIPRVQRAVRYAVGRDAEAGDLMNTCIAEILKGLGGYRGTGSLEAWADRVTYRVMMRQLKRRRRRERTVGLDPNLERHEPEQGVDECARIDVATRLRRALGELPEERRLTLILRVVMGHSVPEVAELTEVGIHTVRARIRQGLKDLRQSLSADPATVELLAGVYDA